MDATRATVKRDNGDEHEALAIWESGSGTFRASCIMDEKPAGEIYESSENFTLLLEDGRGGRVFIEKLTPASDPSKLMAVLRLGE